MFNKERVPQRIKELEEVGLKYAFTCYKLQTPTTLIVVDLFDISFYSDQDWNKLIQQIREKT